ncbi:Gfo/Idh/MocA family protein [Mycoplasma sp. SG1]|uniref:Gfo/Idh/MocA family protein n=1 Tax=Mycoplasma sp. SG1 TaxID=2810348 RepID=UPI0020248B8E|nr:Gfo/Idh/MocA family oxidoreductase [Mycoplasma sp. SG1]URM52939.1 Gfo/Idh/MocA family oxidoreductase [Mycoplasma sp. SG1]
MRVLTIGTGWIVDKFIDAWKTLLPQGGLVVYSRDMDKAHNFAKKHNAEGYGNDFAQLIKDHKIHLVYIASPNGAHFEQAKFFANHKINLFIEKPLVCKKDQYQELKSIVKQNNIILFEAYRTKYNPGFQIIEDYLKNKLGKVFQFNISFNTKSRDWPIKDLNKLPNVFNKNLDGGTIYSIGIYCFEFLYQLFGEPEKIEKFTYNLKGVDIYGSYIIQFSNDLIGSVNMSKTQDNVLQNEIIGEKGILLIDSISEVRKVWFIDHKKRSKTLIFDYQSDAKYKNDLCYELVRYLDIKWSNIKWEDEIKSFESFIKFHTKI